MRRALTIALCLLTLAFLGACGDDYGGGGGDGTAASTRAETATAPARETAGECRRVEAPAPKGESKQKKPSNELDPDHTYELAVSTSCGEFTIELDPEAAPKASASLVSLARAGFFDGTVFHRVVPDFVVQGGDPTGSGSGGPGYTTVDKPPAGAAYTSGVVAMAKTGQEPPGAAGSQFFVVTAPDVGLPPDYAIVGRVKRGLEVVQRMSQLGDPATEKPRQPIVLERMRVVES